MNYGTLETQPNVYIPLDPEKNYPTGNPYEHRVTVTKPSKGKRQYKFDETYPYIDRSFSYLIQRNFVGPLFIWFVINVANKLKYGLRVRGRKNLRPYRKHLKGGAVAICNHVYQFDAAAVKQALQPLRNIWIPMYAPHFNGGQYWFVRYVGGIPVPETMGGLRKFDEAFDHYHSKGEWILVFPEEVRWDYYQPLRPFRKGAFSMAYKYNCPMVPCMITYRERKGIHKWFGPQEVPLMTIHVGEPIMPDRSHSRKEEVDRLRVVAHERMEKMAGIEKNPWPAIPEEG